MIQQKCNHPKILTMEFCYLKVSSSLSVSICIRVKEKTVLVTYIYNVLGRKWKINNKANNKTILQVSYKIHCIDSYL